jgi:hypothetical protein
MAAQHRAKIKAARGQSPTFFKLRPSLPPLSLLTLYSLRICSYQFLFFRKSQHMRKNEQKREKGVSWSYIRKGGVSNGSKGKRSYHVCQATVRGPIYLLILYYY